MTVLKSSLNRWHRLSSLCQGSRLVVHSLERLCHQPIPPFRALRVGQRPMSNCSEKFFRRVRLTHHELMATAGTEARPTELFMLYGWTEGP